MKLSRLEVKIAATINSIRDDLSVLGQSSETMNAFLHAFVKMYLVNVPESDTTTRRLAKATAPGRYQTLISNAAQMMAQPDDEEMDYVR